MGVYSYVRSLSRWRGASLLLAILGMMRLMQGIIRYRRMFKFYNSLPGEPDFHWIWGNLHKVRGKATEVRMEYMDGLMRKHKYFYRLWQGAFRPLIMCCHPDSVKLLLKTSEPKPMAGAYQFAVPWLGEGLLIASGQRWARSRRLLTPAFHFDILKPYMEVYNKAADILLGKIARYEEKGESFEVFGHISLCTLDVILKCAMSFDDNIQMKGESHPYVVAVNELSEMWFERGRNPLLYNDFVFSCTKMGRRFKQQCDFVHSISENLIKKRRETLDREGPANKKYLDFLDVLLTARDDAGDGLTSMEIRNEVDTFLFEGHDTTASAISWILYSLATHADIQDKAQAEVDAILDGKDSEVIDWSELPELSYLACVIKEGMRLHCPVPFIQRQLTQPTTIDGTTLPKDTVCTVHLLNLHHNPEVWEDPWEFKPERFFPENMKDKDNYAFVPFSAGPRNCIGQHFAMNEEKVLLARILHRYRLEIDSAYPVKRKVAAVMRSMTGIRVFAKLRQRSQ
ncbi:leukotriene-B4 omega-hydroxylase 3-like isoform X1 [Haliotis rufescens]|uniref:leukotriene-B4 omega-hydroxylase 3-like isoform X1 n=1 Tax=Haliotis rufescens TaxID=6454 RepID=UPI00201F44F4|nr:leukotriene-B4 omega-hydroxylase 3-like isoform X1 [Haliotis rufescens]